MSRELALELVRICRLFNAFEEEAVCCGEVTVTQCIVLQELLEGDRTVTELAGAANLTPSAVTRLLDALAARGWIERRRGAGGDRRQVAVALTGAGRKEAERLRGVTAELVGTVLRRIPAAKRAEVLESLRLLRETMTELAARFCGPACAPRDKR